MYAHTQHEACMFECPCVHVHTYTHSHSHLQAKIEAAKKAEREKKEKEQAKKRAEEAKIAKQKVTCSRVNLNSNGVFLCEKTRQQFMDKSSFDILMYVFKRVRQSCMS